MNFVYFFLLISLLIQYSYNSCININTDLISDYFNTSFSKECYDYTIQNDKDCCNNFLVNSECIDIYSHCNNYNDYIINGIHEICHSHNTTMYNLSYSDYCHQFVLNIEPYCCKNISECINWYTNCATNFTNTNITNCNVPSRFTSNTCTNYTLNIDPNCCYYFNDHCSQIYNWCLQNSPTTTSIFDLFLPPQIGFIIGSTLTTYTDIPTLYDCLQICLDNRRCLSLNYNQNLQYCHLTRHVVEDLVNNQIIHLNDNTNYVYFEKKLKMPNPNTNCNVRNPSLIGDSVCDHTGGYNSADCDYDGGDCCLDSCKLRDFSLLCGISGYYCIDPSYTNTLEPSTYPTEILPSYSPTNHPTNHPTKIPTIQPTYYPSYSPTRIPTTSPSTFPNQVSIKEESNVTTRESNNQGVIIVLIVLLTLMSFMFIGYVIRSNINRGRFYMNNDKSVTFHNPMYDKDETTSNHELYDDNFEDDYEYDEDITGGDSISNERTDKQLPTIQE